MVCPQHDDLSPNKSTPLSPAFEIIPAIDLINGECVRLQQGDYDKKTVFDSNPVAVARRWQDQGASRLHVVDLDGAKAGHPVNVEVIRQIARALDIPVQVGGGIRNLADIKTILDTGVKRVILGTSVIKDPKFAQAALQQYADQIIIGLDAKDGKVAITGWTDVTAIDVYQIAQTMEKFGAKRIIFTDIATDGMLTGPNYASLVALADKVSISIIASGGIATVADIQGIINLNKQNIEGCIIGKALYTNQFSLSEAINQIKS